jgi:hypothetical protein
MTSVQFTLPRTALSPEAAEECRRSVSCSASRSLSSFGEVRFHYEVGLVEPHSGALHLIQVCCQVCVEGRGCCNASVCCDAVCCQLQLPKEPQGQKRLCEEDEEEEQEEVDQVAALTIDLPRTVAASASSHAGLASYPITARELMAHVAKCCDLCLESKGAACCKKDCCAVSCCLVNVEVMGAPMVVEASCCSTTGNKMGSVAVVTQKPAEASARRTKRGACCGAADPDPALAPVTIKKQGNVSACCTKDVVGALVSASLSSSSHGDGHAEEITSKSRCVDKASQGHTIDSLDEHKPPASKCCTSEKNVIKALSIKTCGSKDGNAGLRGGALPSSGCLPAPHEDKPALVIASCASSKCCTGKADEEERQITTSSASCGIKIAGVEPNKCARVKKSCSSASKCCETKVDEQATLLAITHSTAVKMPCGGVAAKGCCTTNASAANKTCGSKKDACAPIDNICAVQPVEVS